MLPRWGNLVISPTQERRCTSHRRGAADRVLDLVDDDAAPRILEQ
jgi:hypothetical protein